MAHEFPNVRMRRLRNNPNVRSLIRENTISVDHLISPLFIRHGTNIRNPVSSMPGQFQISVDQLEQEILSQNELGIKTVLLFGIPPTKDLLGSSSFSDDGIIQQAIREIKRVAPHMLVIADVCLCEYTDNGHCGVIKKTNDDYHLDNDHTLEILSQQALSLVKAGADIVAPSGMIDGMVYALRTTLDKAGYENIPILSYSVKYSSAMYGPFRQAAEGVPQFGDRKSYQMDCANSAEAIRECELDIAEGADMLMVKPAHAYLDVILKVKQNFPSFPLGAYHTSAEYSMIKAAAANDWINEKNVAMEVLIGMRRAGADFIITYYAKEVAGWLKHGF